MAASAIANTQQGNQLSTKSTSSKMSLKTEDFIKMMITQLQNQDPLEPAKNEQLLAQMSQIGQLQSSTQLQESLKSLVLQNNLGASGNLIGKMVRGSDENNEAIDGLVNSVRVENDKVFALVGDNTRSHGGSSQYLNDKAVPVLGFPINNGYYRYPHFWSIYPNGYRFRGS